MIGCFADGNQAQATSGDPVGAESQAEVLYLKGFERQKSGKASEAVELYKQALQIDPKHVESHWELGWSYYAQTEWALAVGAWEQVKALDPSRDQLDVYL
ncbi:MAG: tetratricopeptide repeat protein, partial [Myxococcota bacterium]